MCCLFRLLQVLGKGWDGDSEGKQAREMGKREHALQLFCRHLLLFSSSAFGIAGMREEAAGLQWHWDEDEVIHHSCLTMTTKRKIKKFSQSHEEINQIYQSPQLAEASPQRNESSHRCSNHNSFGLVEDSWCNVGERPCRLKIADQG